MTAKLLLDGIRSNGRQKTVHQHVRGKLVIYPHANDPVYGQRNARKIEFSWDPKLADGTLVSLVTHKTLGTASGNWQAVIKVDGDSQLDLASGGIIDGDWADVTFVRNGVEFLAMRGPIDSVRESRTSGGGATIREYTILGKDHGAPFEMPIAWQSIWVQKVGELFKGIMKERVKGAIGGSPDEMIKILIEAAFEKGSSSNKSNWTLPPGLGSKVNSQSDRPYFYEALGVDAAATRGAYYNELQAWTQVGQSLHQTLQQWCNPLLNEIYYDLGPEWLSSPEQMMAYLRERPFVNREDGLNSPWFSLDEISIPDWLIESYDIGFDGSQRYTLFELIANFGFLNASDSAAAAVPMWDYEGIQTHGLRAFQENVKYIAKDSTQTEKWKAERKIWQQLLTDWYAPNPYFRNGSISIGILVPEIRIGKRFKLDTDNLDTSEHYYVEGVENRYSYGRSGHSGRTKLTLTRGFPGSDRARVALVALATKNFSQVFE